ncbi:MAG: Ig domain-containing protein [Terriglobales bacterium]
MRKLSYTGEKACRLALLISILLLCSALHAQNGPPVITGATLPKALVRSTYNFRLTAEGGLRPLAWSIDAGDLPAGLTLDPASGMISGVPRRVGLFRFEVKVTDSSTPAKVARRGFSLEVSPAFGLRWTRAPAVNQDRLDGSLQVTNHTADEVDLTLIVVAVNEVGKAFALGYQHFAFPSDSEQEVPFGATLPRGFYIVHADAVGEVPDKYTIYREALQSRPLEIE